MLTTLSQITPPRDGGSLAMSIGPVPPPPCFPVNSAICLRSFPNDDVLSPLVTPCPEWWDTGVLTLPPGPRSPWATPDGGPELGIGIVLIRSFWRP